MAELADRPPLPTSHRGRMGVCRPRWPRAETISMGRRSAAITSELRHALAKRARTRRAGCAKCVWTLRYRGQRPRMVQRLVRPELLRDLAGAQPSGPGREPDEAAAQGFPRRIMAPSHQGCALLGPLQHTARISVRRLRLSGGVRCAVNRLSRSGVTDLLLREDAHQSRSAQATPFRSDRSL